jgi:hypothetical protein
MAMKEAVYRVKMKACWERFYLLSIGEWGLRTKKRPGSGPVDEFRVVAEEA